MQNQIVYTQLDAEGVRCRSTTNRW
jgi:hypothetical protein